MDLGESSHNFLPRMTMHLCWHTLIALGPFLCPKLGLLTILSIIAQRMLIR